MSTSVRTAVIPARGSAPVPSRHQGDAEGDAHGGRPPVDPVGCRRGCRSRIDDIVIITSPHKKALEDHFDRMAELEAALEPREARDARRRASHHRSGDVPLHSAGRHSASVMPSARPPAMCAMSRSRCCSPTSCSPTGARPLAHDRGCRGDR